MEMLSHTLTPPTTTVTPPPHQPVSYCIKGFRSLFPVYGSPATFFVSKNQVPVYNPGLFHGAERNDELYQQFEWGLGHVVAVVEPDVSNLLLSSC